MPAKGGPDSPGRAGQPAQAASGLPALPSQDAPAENGFRYAEPKTNKSFLSTVVCEIFSSNSD
jgi:hypothetical protein